VLLVVGVLAGSASAAAEQFEIEVMVSKISEEEGEIDPRGAKLHKELQKYRHESLEVLKIETLRLGIDDVRTVELPNGTPLTVRPLQLTDRGLLLAATAGTVQTDLKLRNGHLVVIRVAPYQNGDLVVSFETRW